ncbi:MAG: pitrilysin family protein [Patescibacteria group bacterium]
MHTFKDFNIELEETTLSNGIRVLLLKKENAPICIEVAFASGSSFDPEGKEGLSHFTEHMILAGTETFPSKDKLAGYIENVGGVIGARTSPEFLSVRVEIVDKDDIECVGTILKEVFTRSLFTQNSIETDRKAILSEINDKVSSPSGYVWEIFKNIAFQKTVYEHNIPGSKDSVKAITRGDLLSFYEEMLSSGRAIAVASGDIEIDELTRTIEDNITIKNSENFNFDKEVETVRDESIVIKKYPGQEVTHLIIGFRTCPITDDDVSSLYVISDILGGGRASSLKKKMRYEKGLVYGVSANSVNFARAGFFSIKTSVSNKNLQESLDIITEEFNRVREGKISEEELNFAKNRIIKSKKRKLQTSESWVKEHISNYLAGNLVTVPDELNDLEKITLKELGRVGEKYFKKDSWYLAMCGDVEEKDFSINF